MSNTEAQLNGAPYAGEREANPFLCDAVFATNVDPLCVHDGTGAAVTALPAPSRFFAALGVAEEDAEEGEDDVDDDDNSNDVLLRLLNEVRAVDDAALDDSSRGIDVGSEENAVDALFSVAKGDVPKSFGHAASGVSLGGATAGGIGIGGFTVEGNTSYHSVSNLPPPPPPPPPPPAYGTPSIAPRSPYSTCYSGIPHLPHSPGSKPPPPSFAEAMATAHGTPASLPSRLAQSHECSPVLAHYMPPVPAAPQETVLLRNNNGIFLMQPVSKPTPPYTPPAGHASPPISPLPRYSLPPAAAASLSPSMAHNFLGSSMAQAGVRTSSLTEPPQYTSFGSSGGSPYLGATAAYPHGGPSVRSTPSFMAAPPPYTGGSSR